MSYWEMDSDDEDGKLAGDQAGPSGPRDVTSASEGSANGDRLLNSDEHDQEKVFQKIKEDGKGGKQKEKDPMTYQRRQKRKRPSSVEILAYDESDTIEELRKEIEELKKDRSKKRKLGNGGVDGDLTDDVPLPDIPREDIAELRDAWQKEAAYLKNLHSNVYVRFAIAIAEKCDGANAKNGLRYLYVNDMYKGAINTLFVKDTDNTWAIATSSRALQALGNTLRTFPGNKKDRAFKNMTENFTDVYNELATAVRRMHSRKAMLEVLSAFAKPGVNGTISDILVPELISVVESLLGILKEGSVEWKRSGYTPADLINDNRLYSWAVEAVANIKNDRSSKNKPLAPALGIMRTLEKMRGESIAMLLSMPPNAGGRGRTSLSGRFIETSAGVQIASFR